MRFYQGRHRFTCGVDLHARTMYLCVLDPEGQIVLHQNIPTSPGDFLTALTPYRDDLVVGVECMFTWYWLADLCQLNGIPFLLGHALYMRAIHGAKAKNDRLDAYKLAVMIRGGAFPMAYVYPRDMRATRDLLRRRTTLVRFRAELMAHVTNTASQANLPAFGTKTNRMAVDDPQLDRFPDPMTKQSVQLDLATIHALTSQIDAVERCLAKQVRQQQPRGFDLLKTVHGIGPILAMTILYEIHDIQRFPRVQDFASYARLVACPHESAGKRSGSGGRKIGNAHLKWAFSEAAVLYLSRNPQGQAYRNRLARKHGRGKALSILAHKLGRTVYHMLKRQEAFDPVRFLAA